MTTRHRSLAPPIWTALAAALVLSACGAPTGADVVAEYDGGVITRQDFDSHVESLDPKRLRTDAAIPAEDGMRELLREYATTRILADEGWDPLPAAEPVLYMSPHAGFLVSYYRQRIGKRTHEVTEEAAREAYEELLESRFTLPERIRFQHVFLRSDRHGAADLETLERRVVTEYRRGTSFADLVAKYSESGSKANRGIVGPVFRGRLEESFEDQLFALPVDKQPAVIRTERGSHVVLVLEKNARHVLPFEEVRTQVVAGIIGKRDEAARNELFESLRERFGVVDRSDQEDLSDDEIAVTVGDRSISRAELDDFLNRSGPFGAAHQSANVKARHTMVDNLITHNLMYLDAVDQGLDQEPNFLERWRLREQATRAATALDERMAQWAEGLDDEMVLAHFRQHEGRFAIPRRLDISYIFVPYGGLSPFEKQLRIEELKRIAMDEGFDSQVLADRCAEEGAVCASPGFVNLRDAARIGPKFQRAVIALDEGAVSEPVKDEHGLFVVAVHTAEERRPMTPPDDMDYIRARYIQLEQKRITAEIRDRLLEEHHFRIVAPLTGTGDPNTAG